MAMIVGTRRAILLSIAAMTIGMAGNHAQARIVKVEITSREAFAGGAAFGASGAYERIIGIAHGEVDPADARNAVIVDLDKAARDASGKVSYSTPFFILRPLDSAKGNGALLYEVNNRGMKLLPGLLMGAAPDARNPQLGFNDPRSARDVGDGLLLQLGFTLVWSGWDPNAPRAYGGLALDAPMALDKGAPLERPIRDEFMPSSLLPGLLLHLSYETASLDNSEATLTMRWHEAAPATPVPTDRWHFADARTVELLPSGTRPQNGALYELRYRARGAQIGGLGFAATRDLVAYLRQASDTPTPAIRRTLAIGVSQSARYLRGFVAQGFNSDEGGHRVFDGMLMYIGGAGKVFLNAGFSQPGRTNTQYSDHFFPDFDFPYSAVRQKDPTGSGDGAILRADRSDPLFMEINTSTEYWQKAASLIATDPAGSRDARLPDSTRAYFLPGFAHAPYPIGQSEVVHPINLLSPAYALRALVLRLDAWVGKAELPPPSVLPRIDQNTLVARADLKFPGIPQVAPPRGPNAAQRIADWTEARAATGPQPQVRVPQVDDDGIDRGGVRMPEITVPLGTALGWNLYNGERSGETGGLVGSFIPFAKTRAERLATNDPRLSLAERYTGKDDYVAKFRQAVYALVTQGFIRAGDAEAYVAVAARTHAFD